jgi:hypothetical protein
MKGGPFQHVAERPWRKSIVNSPRFHLDRDLVFPVDRMEVRNPMFTVKHADDDTEDA